MIAYDELSGRQACGRSFVPAWKTGLSFLRMTAGGTSPSLLHPLLLKHFFDAEVKTE
jgi:hypothetical protein